MGIALYVWGFYKLGTTVNSYAYLQRSFKTRLSKSGKNVVKKCGN